MEDSATLARATAAQPRATQPHAMKPTHPFEKQPSMYCRLEGGRKDRSLGKKLRS